AILIWQSSTMGSGSGGGTASILTMGMGVAIFLAMWIAMMAAMMFPTAAPMVLMYARVQSSRRAKGGAYVPAGFFVVSYLLLLAALRAPLPAGDHEPGGDGRPHHRHLSGEVDGVGSASGAGVRVCAPGVRRHRDQHAGRAARQPGNDWRHGRDERLTAGTWSG